MIAGQRAFVTAGQVLKADLVCDSTGGTPSIFDSTMTATFYPDGGVIVSALTDDTATPDDEL